MQQQSAFTWFEVLIVLTLSLLVMSFAIPRWQIFWDNSNDKILRATLLNAIQLARKQALNRGMPVALSKMHDWSNGQIIMVDINGDGTISDHKQIIATEMTAHPHGKTYWRGFPFYRDYLQFQPAGHAATDNGVFWHCHSQQIIWAIVVNKFGMTHVAWPDKNGTIQDSQARPLGCS